MRPNNSKKNLLETYHNVIMFSAGRVYHMKRRGEEVSPGDSRVDILPLAIDGETDKRPHDALVAQAQVDMMARAICDLALLRDTQVHGGVMGAVATVEIGARRILDRPHTSVALQPGGMVDVIRGIVSVANKA
jgi:hypothetical protein